MRHRALRFELGFHRRIIGDVADRGRQLVDHRLRRARRRQHRRPRPGLRILDAGLVDGRHVRQGGRARGAGHRQRAQLAGVDVGNGLQHRREQHVDAAGHQVGHGGAAALVGHVHQVDPGGLLEDFARQVGRAAGARTGVGVLAGLRARQRHQFRHVLGRQAGGHHQHERQVREQRHRREGLGRVGMQLVDPGIDGQHAGVGEQQRVAVGIGARHQIGGDLAAGARTVVHHHRGGQLVAQRGRQQARRDVGAAAGGERHDQVDRAFRVRRGPRGGGQDGTRGQGQRGGDEPPARAVGGACLHGFLFVVSGSGRGENDAAMTLLLARPVRRLALRPSIGMPADG